MQKQYPKPRRFNILSNNFRKIIFIALITTTALNHSQWLDAYIPDFKVNDDNINSYQTNSQIGVDTAGNFTIVWYDARNFPGQQYPSNIYCQRYNKDGQTLGNNFIIGQDSVSAPKITVLQNGTFIVLWFNLYIENVYDYYQYYFQRFDKNGFALCPPSKVMDTAYIYSSVLPAGYCISSDSLGRFVVCWSKGNDAFDTPNIYFQRFDSAGARLGTIDSVTDGNSTAEFPDLAMNKDGSFVITWQDDRNSLQTGFDIYLQKFDLNGNKIGSNIKVNSDNTVQLYRGGQKISTNGKNKLVITWNDPRNCSLGEIFYQVYDSNNIVIGINRKANTSNCNIGTGVVNTSMRIDGNFVIYWSDWNLSGREQIFTRRFNNIGNPVGNQYMVSANSPAGTTQRADNIKLFNDKVYSTWTDDRNGGTNNYDVYCNVRGFQNPDTVIGISNISETVKEYRLYPAYPNPFNPETTIKYQISKNNTNVKITVYDIKGSEIEILYNNYQNTGVHNIKWNAVNFSSGIYFIELQTSTGYREIQKAVLIK